MPPSKRAAWAAATRSVQAAHRVSTSATSSATSSAVARGGRSQAHRGADLRYNMEITLEEAARGTEKQIRIPVMEECETCSGSGAKPGTSATTCQTCAGHGQVRMQQGFFSVQQTCPRCHGSGKQISSPCKDCHGSGRVKKQKTLEIKIPAGIDSGMRLRHSGHGEAGSHGAPHGDLYVEIHIKPHSVFQRDGDDLHCEMPISFTTAALGRRDRDSHAGRRGAHQDPG